MVENQETVVLVVFMVVVTATVDLVVVAVAAVIGKAFGRKCTSSFISLQPSHVSDSA